MSFARKQTAVSRSREKVAVPRRVSDLKAIAGDNSLPATCDRSIVDGPLPLRFLDNFSILVIHEGEWVRQDALESVVNGPQFAVGRVPLGGARGTYGGARARMSRARSLIETSVDLHELDWSTSFVVRASIVEWSLDQDGILWVRSDYAWYQVAPAAAARYDRSSLSLSLSFGLTARVLVVRSF